MSDTEKLGSGFKVTPRVKGRIQPLRDCVMIEEMQFGMQTTKAGLIIIDDDGADHGIKPRWGRVHAVGPDQKDISVGQYILINHGRWTRGVEIEDPESGKSVTIRMVDNKDILLVSDNPMDDMLFGNKTGV